MTASARFTTSPGGIGSGVGLVMIHLPPCEKGNAARFDPVSKRAASSFSHARPFRGGPLDESLNRRRCAGQERCRPARYVLYGDVRADAKVVVDGGQDVLIMDRLVLC